MGFVPHVDADELEKAIDRSGLKTGFICDTLGISRQAFDKKKKGKTPFRKSEVYVLCDLLHIVTVDEKTKIFYPNVRL